MAADNKGHYKTFGRRRSLRLIGQDYSETRAYHVTWDTHKRTARLASRPLASEVLRTLEQEARRTQTDLYAYCVMPDHVHVLLQCHGADLIQYIQAVKGKTTRSYWKLNGEGKLWQRGFYDHALRTEESIRGIAHYILANPVRAGLVEEFKDYAFSGSTVFKLEEL